MIELALVAVAAILAGIALLRSRGESLEAWAVLLISIALLWRLYG